MPASPDRRRFLKSTSASLATLAALGASQASASKSKDQLVVGIIGCGGRGLHDAAIFQDTPGVKLAYVCDVDSNRRAKAVQKLNLKEEQAVDDMRRILDDKSVDAVVIATPDHWHSLAGILACDAGKHAYVEKPISHNIREGRLLVEASARNRTLVQHGTQGRSTGMTIDAVRLLREGVIGDVLVAKCWNIQRRGNIGHQQPSAAPPELDYENWLGAAPSVPFQENRTFGGWHWWYDFGTGDMGNDGVHDLDYTRWGLGVETHPTRVVAAGGKFFFDDDQQFPDTQQVTFEYDGQPTPLGKRMLIYEQRLWSTNYPHNTDSGAEFYGTKGQMVLSRRGKIEVQGDRGVAQQLDIKPQKQDDVAHVHNFCDAIRGDATLNADALVGHLSATLCHLGNIATRVGRALTFDAKTERIIGDDEANALVHRNYRDHWGRPKGV